MKAYIGEIRVFAGDFAPVGWELCDGRKLQVEMYGPLFSLLGDTYGGDGETTFGLPNLEARIPVHLDRSMVLGQQGGLNETVLAANNWPKHRHAFMASTADAQDESPAGKVLARTPASHLYYGPVAAAGAVQKQKLNPASIDTAGQAPPSPVKLGMPTVRLAYIICVTGGEFPTE